MNRQRISSARGARTVDGKHIHITTAGGSRDNEATADGHMRTPKRSRVGLVVVGYDRAAFVLHVLELLCKHIATILRHMDMAETLYTSGHE